jgi:hypothetical protein
VELIHELSGSISAHQQFGCPFALTGVCAALYYSLADLVWHGRASGIAILILSLAPQ